MQSAPGATRSFSRARRGISVTWTAMAFGMQDPSTGTHVIVRKAGTGRHPATASCGRPI